MLGKLLEKLLEILGRYSKVDSKGARVRDSPLERYPRDTWIILDWRKIPEDNRKIPEKYSEITRKILFSQKILGRYSKDTRKILERYSKDTRKKIDVNEGTKEWRKRLTFRLRRTFRRRPRRSAWTTTTSTAARWGRRRGRGAFRTFATRPAARRAAPRPHRSHGPPRYWCTTSATARWKKKTQKPNKTIDNRSINRRRHRLLVMLFHRAALRRFDGAFEAARVGGSSPHLGEDTTQLITPRRRKRTEAMGGGNQVGRVPSEVGSRPPDGDRGRRRWVGVVGWVVSPPRWGHDPLDHPQTEKETPQNGVATPRSGLSTRTIWRGEQIESDSDSVRGQSPSKR